MRNVRIYTRFSEVGKSSIALALEIVTKTLMQVSVVDSLKEADLVLTDSLRRVEKDWDKSKQYALLTFEEVKGSLPENVRHLRLPFAVVPDLCKLIAEVAESLPDEETKASQKLTRQPAPAGAKRVLVIDDTPANIQSAFETIPESYDLVTATGYDEAMKILAEQPFDWVLTDLHMPMSSRTLSDEAFKLGELIPYGLLLVVEFLRQGIHNVAVVTDLNHHQDPFSAAFDHFTGKKILAGETRIQLLHAPLRPDGSKDWGKVLD